MDICWKLLAIMFLAQRSKKADTSHDSVTRLLPSLPSPSPKNAKDNIFPLPINDLHLPSMRLLQRCLLCGYSFIHFCARMFCS